MTKLILLGLLSFNVLATTTEIKIPTDRNDEIEAILHTPSQTAQLLPAVLIAPGQGYHMDLPLIVETAKLLENNTVVLRFNWNYFTKGGQPSEGLVNENQDMAAALKYLRSLKYVDQSKITIAGKSLGTFVAYQQFILNKDLLALHLLTPVCTYHWDDNDNQVPPFPVSEKNYPDLKKETRPIHLTLGSKDPLCFTVMLYDHLKDSSGNITVGVFAGDHSLNIGKWDDPKYKERNSRNIKAAIHSIVNWINTDLER